MPRKSRPASVSSPVPPIEELGSPGHDATAHICPWCSAEYRGEASACPSCGAALVANPVVADEAIPGLTVVSPELRDYEYRVAHPVRKPRTSLLKRVMGGQEARIVQPVTSPSSETEGAPRLPSVEVRLEMARIEREIVAARLAALQEAALQEAALQEAALQEAALRDPAPDSAGSTGTPNSSDR